MTTTITAQSWKDGLSTQVIAEADDWKARIHVALSAAVCTTGQALRAMKSQMPHGAFESWWREELGLKDRKQVSDLMAASEVLESASTDSPLYSLPPRTLAVLKRSGDPSVLEEAIGMLDNGQKLTEMRARELVKASPVSLPKRMGPSTAGRLLGFLNDQRCETLATFIKANRAAKERFDKIKEVLVLTPGFEINACIERCRDGKATHLEMALDDALQQVFETSDAIESYRRFTWNNPVSYVPPINDPLWDKFDGLKDLYLALDKTYKTCVKDLQGHRKPEEAVDAYMLYLFCMLDPQVVLSIKHGWDSYVKEMRKVMSKEVDAFVAKEAIRRK